MSTLAELLADARAALHRLNTGAAAVSVRDSNGETIEYQAANAPRLAAYVSDLERQIGGRRPVLSIVFRTSKGV